MAILISGRGSNLAALLGAVDAGRLTADPILVVSSHAGARGLAVARQAGIATAVVDYRRFATRPAFDAAVQRELESGEPDLVILAGFMRILTGDFVQRWRSRLVNIHPSLLPRHPGLRTHQRVLEAGDRTHGATVHLVSEKVDAGTILGQASLRVDPADTERSLGDRVLVLEHRLYPAVLQALIAGDYLCSHGMDLERLTPALPLLRWHG